MSYEVTFNAAKQPIITAAVAFAGKLVGWSIKPLSFLNFPGSFKQLCSSAFLISEAFQLADYAVCRSIDQTKSLQSYKLTIRAGLSGIGGYTTAWMLSQQGMLPRELKTLFFFLAGFVYLGTHLQKNYLERDIVIGERTDEALKNEIDERKQAKLREISLEDRVRDSEVQDKLKERIDEEERKLLNGQSLNDYVKERLELKTMLGEVISVSLAQKMLSNNLQDIQVTKSDIEAILPFLPLNKPIALKKALDEMTTEDFNSLVEAIKEQMETQLRQMQSKIENFDMLDQMMPLFNTPPQYGNSGPFDQSTAKPLSQSDEHSKIEPPD